MAVGHQRAAVGATPVKDADLFVVADDNEIDAGHEGVCGHTILELVQGGDR